MSELTTGIQSVCAHVRAILTPGESLHPPLEGGQAALALEAETGQSYEAGSEERQLNLTAS